MNYKCFDTGEVWTEDEIRDTYEHECELYEQCQTFDDYLEHLLDLGRQKAGGIVEEPRILDDLYGEFWTRFDELLRDIEEEGYTIEFATEEYITITEGDDEYIVRLDGTGNTMWIKSIEVA